MESLLFETVRIKDLPIRNRFVRSATFEGLATADGRPTEELQNLYCTLAEGEVGLIITSGALIEAWKSSPAEMGLLSPLAIHHDDFIDHWLKLNAAVHERGAKIAMQIGHLGRQDVPQLRGSAPPAPSAVPIESSGVTPREMSRDEIKNMVEMFAQAGRRVREAGFDAVQHHGAHGNIITNFMSPFTNRRTDEYGGSLENRVRFVVEMMERTRALVGNDFPVMIKLSFSDFVDGGLTVEDAVEMAVIMAGAGIDCIEVSGGTLSETRDRISVKAINRPEKEAYFEPFAKALKKRVDIPVILVGGFRTRK